MSDWDIKRWLVAAINYGQGRRVLANLYNVDLSGARLIGARLDGAVLTGASLIGSNLDGAVLIGAWLDGAWLDGARLDGAVLAGARLDGANLNCVSLDGARLDGASLTGASLIGSNLEGTRLDGAWLDGARLDGTVLDPANKPNADVGGFAHIGDWVIGWRTADSPTIGGDGYEVRRTYRAPVFSTCTTECHPGLYLWPQPENDSEIMVLALASDVHRAGNKWRCREFTVVAKRKRGGR